MIIRRHAFAGGGCALLREQALLELEYLNAFQTSNNTMLTPKSEHFDNCSFTIQWLCLSPRDCESVKPRRSKSFKPDLWVMRRALFPPLHLPHWNPSLMPSMSATNTPKALALPSPWIRQGKVTHPRLFLPAEGRAINLHQIQGNPLEMRMR